MIRAKHLIAYLLGVEEGGGKTRLRDEEYIDVSAATKSVLPDDPGWPKCPYINKTDRGDHGLPPLDLQCKPHDSNCFCAQPKSIFVPLESLDVRSIKGKRDKETAKKGGKGKETSGGVRKEATVRASADKTTLESGGRPPLPPVVTKPQPLSPELFLGTCLPPPEVLRNSVNPVSCYTPVKVILGLIILACIGIAALTVLKQYCDKIRVV
ncbi:protein ORF-J [Elephant endotheliotropic herpesvirus 3A]|uniref:Protein ORF-J n=1 Tax=Elephant endotheliotropic herpesvirus 3A TaxID=1329409 RepID=A0A866VSN8_9BETA|nr:protein ORF-J [Elephant endotheliotropic herpesvirus 3A]QOE74436.1 protein ORF-J [Elephant endotheliotropic herpesvirus 3A]